MDRDRDEAVPESRTLEQDNVRDRDNDRAGAGGAVDDSPGAPGGTLGTGAREQDQ